MKRFIYTLCMVIFSVAMYGQQPVITLDKTSHDFGKINEADGRVTTVFTIKNEGMAPLVLSNVRASCGCTTPNWTREPIEPGQTGTITVTYNPNGRPGRFQKTVTITSNATEPTKRVTIKGEVIPKQAKPTNKYTIAVGALNMKSKELNFGNITKGDTKVSELEYTNLSGAVHEVALAVNGNDTWMENQVTLTPIKDKEVGKFVFAIDTKATNLYGPVEAYAYVVVDGKKELTETYKLTIKANIVEDFSSLTIEQKQQSPILETKSVVDLGTIAAGKHLKGQIHVKNIGVNPLQIRRAYSVDKQIALKPCKAVKSGRTGNIQVDINTKGRNPGKYSREVVIISNDYEHSIQKVTLMWTIQ
jgi:hypothetical protein